MVYFHREDGWHNTQWKVGSKFEKGKPGWAELRSEKATLRLSVDVGSGEAEVQSSKFEIAESDTLLVLLGRDASAPQKIIPLVYLIFLRQRSSQPQSCCFNQTRD